MAITRETGFKRVSKVGHSAYEYQADFIHIWHSHLTHEVPISGCDWNRCVKPEVCWASMLLVDDALNIRMASENATANPTS
jgi:hypothetical protein